MKKQRIIILGGGFGGVTVAAQLGKLLTAAERETHEVILVSRDNYLVFQPLLPEVISGSVGLNHVIAPIRRMAPRATIYTREVLGIDAARREVMLSAGPRQEPLTLVYDQLVIALGTRLDDSRVPGMREHAMPFKYLGDALRLRHQLVQALEHAEVESDAATRRSLLTFVVAGGGFSGVECIAEMNDFLREAIRAYVHLREDELRLVLLQRGARILPEMAEPLAQFAHRLLEKRGVEIQLGAELKVVSARSVVIGRGADSPHETIETRTVVATVPAGPHPVLATLPFPQNRGRLVVDEFTAVKETPGVWAIGDAALIQQIDGQLSPPTAQHALRQAKTCAQNIVAGMRGRAPQRFTFTGLGKLGSLGRRSAVAEIFGLRLTGLVAWLLWRGVYATKFPGLGGQLRLLTDWVLDVFLSRDITQLRLFHDEPVHREHFEPGEIVFTAGAVGDRLYCIAKGSAEVTRDGTVLATLKTGEVFGEAALLSDALRNATVRAVTPLDVVAVTREAAEELLAHLPGFAPAMRGIMQDRGEPDPSIRAASL